MFDVKRRIYLRVNMQDMQVIDSVMFDAAAIDQSAERAMNHFGELEADEDIFTLVDTDWSHSYKRKH